MFSHEHEVEMSRRYRKDHDLMGHEADDLTSIFDTLREEDVWQYRYPDDHDLNAIGVRGIYLGNYVRWDPKAQHDRMVESHGYKGARFARTFDTYDYVDCFNYMDLHDHLKMVKHGYSKVTDHACREIRHGRLSREEGQALVAAYQDQPLRYLDKFLDWLGVDETGLNFIIGEHRSPRVWDEVRPGRWVRRETPEAPGLDTEAVEQRVDFRDDSQLDYTGQDRYITVGKGYPL